MQLTKDDLSIIIRALDEACRFNYAMACHLNGAPSAEAMRNAAQYREVYRKLYKEVK